MVERIPNREAGKDVGELEKNRHELTERLSEDLEKRSERSKENEPNAAELESTRNEALEQAQSKEEQPEETAEKPPITAPTEITKKDLDIRFNRTMDHIQKDMSPASRTFSKIIHHPVVDKTSEVIGNTVARPNLILAGGIGTLTVGLAVYLIAKNYGYTLSGFESIGSFILGWSVGAIIEFARVGFKNKRDV